VVLAFDEGFESEDMCVVNHDVMMRARCHRWHRVPAHLWITREVGDKVAQCEQGTLPPPIPLGGDPCNTPGAALPNA
jgi:hypothetical protein